MAQSLSPPDSPASGYANLILAESVRSQYRGLRTSCINSLVLASLLMTILFRAVPLAVAVGWLAVMYLHVLGRYLLLRAYEKNEQSNPAPDDAPRWGRYAIAGAAVSGVIWGAGGVLLFVPGLLEYQLVLLFVLIGVASSAVYASATYLPAFYAFVLPAIMPAGLWLLAINDTVHIVLGLLMLFYVPVTARFAKNLNAVFRESLRLRFENLHLVGQYREQKDTAEAASLAKSQFLAATSHDLRQPLHALNLFVEQLRSEPLTAHQQGLLERITRSVDALGGQFDILLDISRLDAGVVEVNRTHFPLRELFDAIRADFEPIALQKGLRFKVASTLAFIESDRESLTRILRNLMQNAVRYTERGGVLIGSRRCGAMLRIEVHDTGPGIADAEREHIFREYYQVGNPERDRRKGLGLGLAIVERLTRLLGHRLTLRSVPGKGSSFAVEVPLGERSLWRAPDISSHSVPLEFFGKTIAIVEDEIEILDGMRSLLESWRCTVVSADSGAQLVAQLQDAAEAPDLIISDYRLPDGETGAEVIAALREEFNSDVPALLITGDTATSVASDGDDDGDPRTLLLYKPVQPARLRAAMRNLLKRPSG